MTEPLFPGRIVAIELEAENILSFKLRPMDPALPERIDPGSHVDVHLPNGMMRSYSLSNGPEHQRVYRLTVARDANSRGGSTYMHDTLRVGQVLEISKPRNNFSLAEQAAMSVFIAGGIGVTPFIPMIARLNELGRPWRMHYCVRSRDRAALVEEIERLAASGSGALVPNYDDEAGILDLAATLASLSADAHVYCCGPTVMLDAFRAGAKNAGIPSDHVHFEYFSSEVESATDGGFVVALRKSGAEITVKPGQTILQALIEYGLNIPYSCEEGICGACETPVIDGVPDHRDMILSDQEKKESKTMMVCCSGSKSPRLVLDL
ncbi:MAG TPA: PDR/VanB family oxidoreductase [Allosphingosinicella sp.]|nr:PDR/VanB family oxidoreductase [Allosphingosinicella sp.]